MTSQVRTVQEALAVSQLSLRSGSTTTTKSKRQGRIFCGSFSRVSASFFQVPNNCAGGETGRDEAGLRRRRGAGPRGGIWRQDSGGGAEQGNAEGSVHPSMHVCVMPTTPRGQRHGTDDERSLGLAAASRAMAARRQIAP
jgi:hypothetical protein